jgi:hypothetical protein
MNGSTLSRSTCSYPLTLAKIPRFPARIGTIQPLHGDRLRAGRSFDFNHAGIGAILHQYASGYAFRTVNTRRISKPFFARIRTTVFLSYRISVFDVDNRTALTQEAVRPGSRIVMDE